MLVEGNVTKVEEKSKLWIYLKNASINKKAAGEGVIVQIPVSAHSNQKRPLAGSKISVYGKLSLFSQASNPGEFDSRSYYHNLGYDFCLSGKTWTQKGSRYDPIAECLWQLKDAIKMRLSRLLEGNIADYGIYCAVLLGDKSELDKEQKELFKDQGIAHILSVSGLHISVVGLACMRFAYEINRIICHFRYGWKHYCSFLFCLYWKCSLDNSCLCHVSYFNDRATKRSYL